MKIDVGKVIIEKYAAIDIGSNAIRMLIANVVRTKNQTTFRKNALVRVPVRLGEDAFASGEISHKNCKQIVKSMKAFLLLMEVHNVKDYLAYATSALREAVNSEELVNEVFKETGIKIGIIDGEKEAEVISNTDVFDLVNPERNFLYVDVGGGSVELSILNKGVRIKSKSFKIGTLRMLNNMVKQTVWDEVKRWIKEKTKGYKEIYLLGTGGNINKLHKMIGLKVDEPILYSTLNSLYEEMALMSYEDRIIELGLNPDRSDVILPATEIYLKALRWSGSKAIYVPKTGLTDGMIKEMVKQ